MALWVESGAQFIVHASKGPHRGFKFAERNNHPVTGPTGSAINNCNYLKGLGFVCKF